MHYTLPFLLLSFTILSKAQTIAPTNSMPINCSGCIPTGWTIVSGTTDVSNTTNAGGSLIWYQTPNPIVNPPNGHNTWVGGFGTEAVQTTVTGLTIGTTYNFLFYAAQIEVDLSSFGDARLMPPVDGLLEVNIPGIGSFTYTLNGTFSGWSLETLTFTATSSSHDITFSWATDPNFRYQWNVSFNSNAVTLPCHSGNASPSFF